MLIRLGLLIIICTLYLSSEDEIGYGWDVPGSNLNIGGYLDMTHDEKRDPKFLFDDIAVLVSASKNRFDFLAEIELSHVSIDFKNQESRDLELYIERLQLSYNLSDEQMLRIGRFNSKLGFWNLAPIPILEDTTTKPHLIGKLFPRYTFGGMFKQEINENNNIFITVQKNKDFTHQEGSLESHEHFSLAYYGEKDDLLWHLSAGSYEDTLDNNFNYLGLAAQYDGEILGLQSELFMQDSKVNYHVPYSVYAQATWHFQERQDFVGRLEHYKDNALNIKENIYLLGYVYRPSRNMALKAEYIKHTVLPLNRVVYSLSVLF